MKAATLTLQFHSWWHAGSGHGRGGEADELVIRDANKIPYLPGRTLKGLLRDAVRLAEDFKQVDRDTTDTLFGKDDPSTLRANNSTGHAGASEPPPFESPGRLGGELQFTNATLPSEFSNWLRGGGEHARSGAFRETFSFTAIDPDSGVARDQSLRMVEVLPPLALSATITGPDDGGWIAKLQKCQGLIRAAGKHRHRGLGRCSVTIAEINEPEVRKTTAGQPDTASTAIGKGCVWLRVELESDVIFSLSAATSGGHDSLDYLPGSVLLGAAAQRLFKTAGFGPDIFLSGQVRFGDGLPVSPDGRIGLPMPLNAHSFKSLGLKGKLINGLTDSDAKAGQRAKNKEQIQQARNGYLAFSGTEGLQFEMEGSYLLKTARDRDAFGTAMERQLFEYDTLPQGQVFFASIRWDERDAGLTAKVRSIISELTKPGIRLGRSRSAEFGQVKITFAGEKEANEIESTLQRTKDEGVSENGSSPNRVHLYLLSDVALAGNSAPRLTPTATDFGLAEPWKLLPEQSFIRTRRYSPWNAFHHVRLTERQVLTRGSVLTFQRDFAHEQASLPSPGTPVKAVGPVGLYTQEGLGCVLVNPDFVLELPVLKKGDPSSHKPVSAPEPAHALVNWVSRRERNLAVQHQALKEGMTLAEFWFKLHRQAMKQRCGCSGKSQWSQIRQHAIAARGDKERLQKSLAEFCTQDLRKKYWLHGKPSLWNCVNETMTKQPDGILACAVIAAAAEKIVSRLQTSEHDQRDVNSGGQS